MSKRQNAPAAAAVSSLSAEIQIKLLANIGVLNADNALIMESLGVADLHQGRCRNVFQCPG